MLARVANSLYWAGRYIERSEHLARYLKVQYFSIFDAPMSQQKEVILRSILHMAPDAKPITQQQTQSQDSSVQQQQQETSEQEILINVAFNRNNPNSILYSVQTARENARSVRYVLSSELWESINRYYHYIKGYDVDFYKTRGLYDFTTNATQHCAIIQSYADSTLIHDDIWAFIKLGIYLERTFQILRILNNKIIDIQLLTKGKKDPLTTYQWTTTLKTLEAFDMYRRRYKGEVKEEQVIQFLLSHSSLPRSAAFTLNRMNYYLSKLTFAVNPHSQLQFQANKLESQFKFFEYEDQPTDIQGFLMEGMQKLARLNTLIEQEYFN